MAANRVVFKNKFNIKVSRAFYRYYTLKHSTFMYFLIVMGLVSVLFISLGMIDTNNTFQAILIYSIAGVGLIFMPTYTFVSIMSSAQRDKKKRGEQTEIYEITKVKIERHLDGISGKYAINWASIESVVESNIAFFFFTVEQEAFTIPKEGLIEGSLDDLRYLIKTYLPPQKNGKVKFVIKDKEYKKVLKEEKRKQKQAKKEKKK